MTSYIIAHMLSADGHPSIPVPSATDSVNGTDGSWVRKRLSKLVKAAEISDVSDGTMTTVTVEGEAILIACVGDQYYAIHNKVQPSGRLA
jgi:hypothetical protein